MLWWVDVERGRSSEVVSQSQLDYARATRRSPHGTARRTAGRGADLSKCARCSQTRRRVHEIHVVEQVIELRAKPQGSAFADSEALDQGNIGIEVARTAKGVPARCAEFAGARKREVCDLVRAEPVNAVFTPLDAADIAVAGVVRIGFRVSRRAPPGADAKDSPALPNRQEAGVPAAERGIEPPWPI